MTKYENVTQQETTPEGYHESVYMFQLPWLPMQPPSKGSVSFAADVKESLRLTYEDIFPAFGTWQGFDSCYDVADKDLVLRAMEPAMGSTMALKRIGDLLHIAVTNYDATLEGYGEEASTYNTEAKAWLADRLAYEADRDRDGFSPEDFERKYDGRTPEQCHADSQKRLGELETKAARLHGQLQDARSWLAHDLDAIKGEELDDVRFNAREEAVTTVDSEEELAHWIKDSGAFGEMDLTDAEIEFLAGQVDLDSLPYDFETPNPEDPDGGPIRWVVGADGNLVRQGSALDPNLNRAIIEALDDNSGIYAKSTTYYDVDPGTVSSLTTTSSGLVLGVVEDHTGATIDGLTVDATGSKVLKGAAKTYVTVIELGPQLYNNSQVRQMEEQANPLMTDEQLDARKRNNDARTFTSTGLGIAVGVGSTALGAGPIAGTAIGLGSGPVIDGAVDQIYTKDWTYDQLQNHDDPFAAERELEEANAQRAPIRAEEGGEVTADNMQDQ